MIQRRSLLLTFASFASAHAEAVPDGFQDQIFTNDRLGKVRFTVPTEWQTYDRHHIIFGSTFLSGKNHASEQFEITFNDADRLKFRWSSEAELREFIAGQMRQYVSQSVERKVSVLVQRGRNTVVYATLTDSQPKPGEFKLITLGAARTGDVVFLIYQLTNERRFVKRIVSVVAGAEKL